MPSTTTQTDATATQSARVTFDAAMAEHKSLKSAIPTFDATLKGDEYKRMTQAHRAAKLAATVKWNEIADTFGMARAKFTAKDEADARKLGLVK